MNTKHLITAFSLLFVSLTAQAQFTIGGKLGFNYSSLPTSRSEVQDKGGKSGFNIGAFARVGTKTYFQPELLYTNTGGKFTIGNATYKPKFNQIEIPLMIGYRFIKLPLFNLHGSIGPSVSFSLSTPTGYNLNSQDYTWKNSSVGGVANVGVDVGNIVIDARYNIGFTKIDDGIGAKLGVFNLSVGYKFL